MHYVAGRRGMDVGAVVLLPSRKKGNGDAVRTMAARTRGGGLMALLFGETGSHLSSAQGEKQR